MGVRDRLAELVRGKPKEARDFKLGQYPAFLADWYTQVGYGGYAYPLQQSMTTWQKTEEISATLPNYMQALRKSPPAFAAQLVRASVLSQARLVFRNRIDRHIFRSPELKVLERPWVNGTTGELLSRMEWNAGLAGNAYVYRQAVDRLRVLRPDWTAIVYGSQSEADDPKGALDGEVVGYIYKNGGFTQQNKNKATVILPEQMAHWSPLPDPMSAGLGMSWLTPALRDLQADTAAEEYKLAFFTNGATPNLVVKASSLLPNISTTQFKEWVEAMELSHRGSTNAFKTLYLQPGADATVIGSNLQQLDLSSITSHSETRISYLSRVPAVILGIAAGLKGSSLNAGNYGEARRNFADSWYYSTLQDACAALGAIINVPGGSELWYDVADVPLLREDAADAASIQQTLASTIVSLVNGGFKPDSVLAAVVGQNMNLLVHDDRFTSVQLQSLQKANGAPDAPQPKSDAPTEKPAPAQASREDELVTALIRASEREIAAPVNHVTVEPAHVQVDVHEREMTMPAPVVNLTVPPAEIHIDAPVTVNTPAVTVEQPDVTVNNTVEPAQVSIPVTVESPEITFPTSIGPPQIQVDAPITLNMPATEPSTGVVVEYDEEGKVIGTRPRSRHTRRTQ